MRFYTQQHKAYCGIDLHARSMYMCILSQDGEILLHRNMNTSPETFLKAIAPIGRIWSSRSNVSLPGTGSPTSAPRNKFPLYWGTRGI
jgi:hypothetical protein